MQRKPKIPDDVRTDAEGVESDRQPHFLGADSKAKYAYYWKALLFSFIQPENLSVVIEGGFDFVGLQPGGHVSLL
jgi:hypothetical protein